MLKGIWNIACVLLLIAGGVWFAWREREFARGAERLAAALERVRATPPDLWPPGGDQDRAKRPINIARNR